MNILFDRIDITLIFVAFIYLSLAVLIYFEGRDRKISYSYVVVILSVILWTIGMILYRSASSENSLFWCQVLYMAATFTASTFLIFAYIFPYGLLPSIKKITLIVIANLTIIVLVSLPDLIIKSVYPIIGQEKEIIWGRWYFLYVLYIGGLFLSGLILLFKKYLKAERSIKSQLKYVLLGYFLGSNLAMVTNLLMVWWGDFRLNWLGQILSAFMVFFTVYAIITHRLMDIKIVLRRSLVYLASVLTFGAPAFVILYYTDKLYPDFIIPASLIALILSVSVFTPVKNYYYRLANKYFFSSLYDSREVIASLTDKLRSTLEAETIYSFIADSLKNAFHTKAVGILTYDKKNENFIIQYNDGFDVGSQKVFPSDKILYEKFARQNEILLIEEIKKDGYQESAVTIELLTRLGIEVLVPLNVKDETIGLIALSVKESNDTYNSEDLQVLEIVEAEAAIAIKNAQLYEETKHFAITLQQEVERQTAELQKTNIELKKLDKTKSEFLSFASHQVKAPMSIVKGYASLILDGTLGPASAKIKDVITKVRNSSDKMILLVNNLLDLRRIEENRMEYNFEEADVVELVKNIVSEMSLLAKNKKLKLSFYSSVDKAKARIDIQKISQVVQNLIDNAIRYTEEGWVKVNVKKQANDIIISVSDTGRGISEELKAKLFSQFTRDEVVKKEMQGTGLGLYIAKQIVLAHQGEIWAESKGLGKGASFYVKLLAKSV